jgi:hypothetical protein
MHLFGQHPQIPFGIHLTLLCDTAHYRWAPLTAKQKVSSLLDETGDLFTPPRSPPARPGPPRRGGARVPTASRKSITACLATAPVPARVSGLAGQLSVRVGLAGLVRGSQV